MGKPDHDEIRDAAREFQAEKGETPDPDKEFSAAEHEARNDAVGTDYEVRDAKEPATSTLNEGDNSE